MKRINLIIAGIILAIFGVVAVTAIVVSKSDKPDLAKNKSEGAVAGVSTEDDLAGSEYLLRLAEHLSNKGAVLYSYFGCESCQAQKDLFKEAFARVNFVECNVEAPEANVEECLGREIKRYPTWIYNGLKYEGSQPLAKLAEITGFNQ